MERVMDTDVVMTDSPHTYLEIPLAMKRIAQTSTEEIGGLLIFEKDPPRTVEGKTLNLLRLRRVEMVAGDTKRVDPNELYQSHEPDAQWVLFHTHPPPVDRTYNGLSGGDLKWLLFCALTAAGDTPKVVHFLFTPQYVHFTELTNNTYRTFRKLVRAYGQLPGASFEEFAVGLELMCTAIEAYIRADEGETDDLVALARLGRIQFVPEDPHTKNVLAKVTTPNGFLDWFRKTVGLLPPGSGGLFQTVSTTTKEWNETLYLSLLDGGRFYERFENTEKPHYNFETAITNALRTGGKRRKRTLRRSSKRS